MLIISSLISYIILPLVLESTSYYIAAAVNKHFARLFFIFQQLAYQKISKNRMVTVEMKDSQFSLHKKVSIKDFASKYDQILVKSGSIQKIDRDVEMRKNAGKTG